jgi:hypothetical protein
MRKRIGIAIVVAALFVAVGVAARASIPGPNGVIKFLSQSERRDPRHRFVGKLRAD